MALRRIDQATETIASLEGSAQVGEAEAISRELGGLLDSGRELVSLSLEGLTRVDVSLFQLLLALRRSLAAKGRRLVVRPLPPEHLVAQTPLLLGIRLEGFSPESEAPR